MNSYLAELLKSHPLGVLEVNSYDFQAEVLCRRIQILDVLLFVTMNSENIISL